jgi:hypothetical protein
MISYARISLEYPQPCANSLKVHIDDDALDCCDAAMYYADFDVEFAFAYSWQGPGVEFISHRGVVHSWEKTPEITALLHPFPKQHHAYYLIIH